MIRIERFFETRKAAEAFKAQYLADYHPAGYGTTLVIRWDGSDWAVTGYRFASCD